MRNLDSGVKTPKTMPAEEKVKRWCETELLDCEDQLHEEVRERRPIDLDTPVKNTNKEPVEEPLSADALRKRKYRALFETPVPGKRRNKSKVSSPFAPIPGHVTESVGSIQSSEDEDLSGSEPQRHRKLLQDLRNQEKKMINLQSTLLTKIASLERENRDLKLSQESLSLNLANTLNETSDKLNTSKESRKGTPIDSLAALQFFTEVKIEEMDKDYKLTVAARALKLGSEFFVTKQKNGFTIRPKGTGKLTKETLKKYKAKNGLLFKKTELGDFIRDCQSELAGRPPN